MPLLLHTPRQRLGRSEVVDDGVQVEISARMVIGGPADQQRQSPDRKQEQRQQQRQGQAGAGDGGPVASKGNSDQRPQHCEAEGEVSDQQTDHGTCIPGQPRLSRQVRLSDSLSRLPSFFERDM